MVHLCTGRPCATAETKQASPIRHVCLAVYYTVPETIGGGVLATKFNDCPGKRMHALSEALNQQTWLETRSIGGV